VAALDKLLEAKEVSLEEYLLAASEYVTRVGELADGPKKAAQVRLSNALGKAIATKLAERLPQVRGTIVVGETAIAGALRRQQSDVTELRQADGPRLAIEIKPINLAVGRAIWNRFGDIRTFAVNIHLRFPFCVVGGVLAIPSFEETKNANKTEAPEDENDLIAVVDENDAAPSKGRKPTAHLVERAIARLIRAGGRKTEGDAPHLVEALAVIFYDPDTGKLDPSVPKPGSGLRWEEFLDNLEAAYLGRFED
jgi:hypothetical protein